MPCLTLKVHEQLNDPASKDAPVQCAATAILENTQDGASVYLAPNQLTIVDHATDTVIKADVLELGKYGWSAERARGDNEFTPVMCMILHRRLKDGATFEDFEKAHAPAVEEWQKRDTDTQGSRVLPGYDCSLFSQRVRLYNGLNVADKNHVVSLALVEVPKNSELEHASETSETLSLGSLLNKDMMSSGAATSATVESADIMAWLQLEQGRIQEREKVRRARLNAVIDYCQEAPLGKMQGVYRIDEMQMTSSDRA